MGWTATRTWPVYEVQTSAIFNKQYRDNVNILATNRILPSSTVSDSTGYICPLLFGRESSSPDYNNAGGADTLASNFQFTIPANLMDEAGDLLVIRSFCYEAVNEAHTFKMSIDGGTTKVTIYSGTGSARYVVSEVWFHRRTATTAAVTGVSHIGTHAAAATANYLLNSGTLGTFDFTDDITVKFYISGSTATSIGLQGLTAMPVLCISGSTP